MKKVSRPMDSSGPTESVDSIIGPIIPIYLYSFLEILISVTLFTLTSGSLDVSLPNVALYPDLPIALVPLVFYLFKQWSSHRTGSAGGFICKEEILEQEEDNMSHIRVGDEVRPADSTSKVEQSGGHASDKDDRGTMASGQKTTTQRHVVHEEDDDLGMRRNELAVWPSLTPDPDSRRRKERKPHLSWQPGVRNDTRGWVQERHSGSVQVEVEVEPSSVPPPWELGNASARSRLR